MKTEVERLDALAGDTARANTLTLQALDALRQNKVGSAEYTLGIVQGKIAHIERQLVLLGAADPRDTWMAGVQAKREAEGLPPLKDECDTPLHLLSSDKARRCAVAVREAAIALRDMETERGIEDGLAERFEDFADIYEMEVFGPKGLEG